MLPICLMVYADLAADPVVDANTNNLRGDSSAICVHVFSTAWRIFGRRVYMLLDEVHLVFFNTHDSAIHTSDLFELLWSH